MKLTNKNNFHIGIAAWLAMNDYNNGSDTLVTDKPIISATALLKSTRQSILTQRINKSPDIELTSDVSDFISSKFGNALHDAIQSTWEGNWQGALESIGVPKEQILRTIVNPDPATVQPHNIPIYIEKRSFKELDDVIISGKYDMVYGGDLLDFKSTATYTYVRDTKREDYILQGSIYRWLNPEIIKSDSIYITFFFTDWQKFQAQSTPGYPPAKIVTVPYQLLSLEDTERYIMSRLKEYRDNVSKPEADIVFCNDKELWLSQTEFRYYSDPMKAKDPNSRCTKRFTSMSEANTYRLEKGKGVINTRKGEAKACAYCPAMPICSQAKSLFPNGLPK
ncbi:MAG: hypothetical protein K0U41_06775 [Gammaproteobacteria bacterium]|nr:hypothetical protein [Gammaproteobacteria bacterium]